LLCAINAELIEKIININTIASTNDRVFISNSFIICF
jgi:hypothetical protein